VSAEFRRLRFYKGEKNAWNDLGNLLDLGAGGRLATLVAQPAVGIFPDGRRWPGPGDRRHSCAAWTNLEFSPIVCLRSKPGDSLEHMPEVAMDASKQRAVKFLEKEIKTYAALSLFLSKKDVKEHMREGQKKMLSPSFYKERVKEAKKLVHELRKPS
jgi:hypothetical protein